MLELRRFLQPGEPRNRRTRERKDLKKNEHNFNSNKGRNSNVRNSNGSNADVSGSMVNNGKHIIKISSECIKIGDTINGNSVRTNSRILLSMNVDNDLVQDIMISKFQGSTQQKRKNIPLSFRDSRLRGLRGMMKQIITLQLPATIINMITKERD